MPADTAPPASQPSDAARPRASGEVPLSAADLGGPAQAPVPEHRRYHTRQLVAHWTIVMLVAMQFLMNAGMQRAFDASLSAGGLVVNGGLIVHAAGGTTILLVMLYRLGLRLTHGAPPPPASLPGWLQIVSRATHWAFYGVLIAMPLAGMAALWLLQPWLGAVHRYSAYALLALIALHAAGAFWHAVKRDGTIVRILQPDPAHGPEAGTTPEQ